MSETIEKVFLLFSDQNAIITQRNAKELRFNKTKKKKLHRCECRGD